MQNQTDDVNPIIAMQGMFQFDQFRFAMINADIPAHIRGMLAMHMLNNIFYGGDLCCEEANLPMKELPEFISRNLNNEDNARVIYQMHIAFEWLESWTDATNTLAQPIWEAIMVALAKPVNGEPSSPFNRKVEPGFGGIVVRMSVIGTRQHDMALRWFYVMRSVSQNKNLTEFTQKQATKYISLLLRSNPTLTTIAAQIITDAYGVHVK